MKNRVEYVDVAKGIGILFVLIIHRIGIPGFGRFVGAFYMPLFYFLSGFTSREKTSEREWYREYWIGKTKYIFSRYLIYNCLLLLLFAILELVKGTLSLPVILLKICGIAYSRNYITISGVHDLIDMDGVCNAPMWFLTSYIVSMGAFLFCRWLMEKKDYRAKRILLVLVMLSGVLNFFPALLPWSLDTAPMCCIFMIAGLYTKKYEWLKKADWKLVGIITIVFVVLAYFNGTVNLSVRNYGRHGLISIPVFMITGIFGSYIFTRVCMKVKAIKVKTVLSKLGMSTLFILAFHLICYKFFDHTIGNPLGFSITIKYFICFAEICLTVVILLVVQNGLGQIRPKQTK